MRMLRKQPKKQNGVYVIVSHAITFFAGLIIHSLINRDDCGDILMKEIQIAKRQKKEVDTPPAAPAAVVNTALRSVAEREAISAPAKQDTFKEKELSFFDIGISTGTDKVLGQKNLPLCLKDDKDCGQPAMIKDECRPFGHFYHTMYQQKIGTYSHEDATPFQFLEVGFFRGHGYDLYREFLPRGECHSIEIACLPPGPQEEGKWPWGNFPESNPKYQQYLDENRLHCGDGSDVNFLMDVWKNEMKVPGAPPLKIVIDDASHEAAHMVQTVLFWLPRIEPGGILFVEDIQPSSVANPFATQFLPQVMKDLHYCGNKDKPNEDEACFPTLVDMIQSIHCEMHICAFERNQKPAKEPSVEESSLPANALDLTKCKSMLPGHW